MVLLTENMCFIDSKNKKFIFDLKHNRLVALTDIDRNNGNWTNISELNLPERTPVRAWLKGYGKPVLLIRQAFTNKYGSTGIR